MTTIKTEFERLKSTLSFSDDKILLDFFDDLPVVDAEELLGKWRGGDFKTGHWGEEELKKQKWFGKWFRTLLDGSPLVCFDENDKLYSNQLMNGECSLWNIEFRGKVSATMVYDGAPIFDHFRKIDDNTLMGLMNGKAPNNFPSIIDNGRYYYFYLERIEAFPSEFISK